MLQITYIEIRKLLQHLQNRNLDATQAVEQVILLDETRQTSR